jgi:hypothetical protein
VKDNNSEYFKISKLINYLRTCVEMAKVLGYHVWCPIMPQLANPFGHLGLSVCFSSLHVGSYARRSWTPVQHMNESGTAFFLHWTLGSQQHTDGCWTIYWTVIGTECMSVPFPPRRTSCVLFVARAMNQKLWHLFNLLSQNPIFLSPLKSG